MSEFQIISSKDFSYSIPTKYFGYSTDEIEDHQNNYQSHFLGGNNDLLLELISDNGEIYQAIFRAGSSLIEGNAILHFNATDRLLIFVKGTLYRLSINEKQCHSNNVYSEGAYQFSNLPEENESYAHAIVSNKHQVLILSDDEGVCCFTWEKVLWKCMFEYAYAGYLELLSVEGDQILIDYYAPDCGGDKLVKIDINNGVRSYRIYSAWLVLSIFIIAICCALLYIVRF